MVVMPLSPLLAARRQDVAEGKQHNTHIHTRHTMAEPGWSFSSHKKPKVTVASLGSGDGRTQLPSCARHRRHTLGWGRAGPGPCS